MVLQSLAGHAIAQPEQEIVVGVVVGAEQARRLPHELAVRGEVLGRGVELIGTVGDDVQRLVLDAALVQPPDGFVAPAAVGFDE